MLHLSPAAAEAMPPLHVDASLLKGAASAKPVAAPTLPVETSPPIVVVPLPVSGEPTAGLKAAAALAGKPGAREHFIQIGAFSTKANAEARMRQLVGELGAMGSKLLIRSSGKLFVLRLGPWADAASARSVRQQLRERHNIDSVYVAPSASGVGSVAASAEAKATMPVAGKLKPRRKR